MKKSTVFLVKDLGGKLSDIIITTTRFLIFYNIIIGSTENGQPPVRT